MRLDPLLTRWPDDPAFGELLDLLGDTGGEAVVADVARGFLLAGLARHSGRPLLVVVATDAEAERLRDDVAAVLGQDATAVFPAWETLPHERLSPRSETVAARVRVLRGLAAQGERDRSKTPPPKIAHEHPQEPGLRVVVVPVRAALQPMAPRLDQLEPIHVERGMQLPLDELLRRLVASGYHRTDLVERRGEVAVRGGLVDFFPPGEEHPVRVELWGDEVESVRAFAVASQRSLAEISGCDAYPCREVFLTPVQRQRARQLASEVPAAGELLEAVANGETPDGVEALLPLLFDELPALTDYLPKTGALIVIDPLRTMDRAEDVCRQAEESRANSWLTAAEGGRAPVSGADYRDLDAVLSRGGHPVVRMGPFVSAEQGAPLAPAAVVIAAQPVEPYRANLARLAGDITNKVSTGETVVVCTEGHGPAERLVEVLREEGQMVSVSAEAPEPLAAGLLVGTASLLHGFHLPTLRLTVIAEGDLYGTRRQTREQARLPQGRRRARGAAGAGLTVEELQPGVVVVHEVHGIGRYVGMEHRTVGGVERDYLLLAYDGNDRLYLPSEQVQAIRRYIGAEDPALSKLGGKEWDRQKARVRKKVREMAGELVRLYAARLASPGHAFGPDAPWQRELEDAFPFTETPDQLLAIEEVKADMEQPLPMDRLLCGDVGYGKTEVAVRAAFKAVMDGKQVAVLVPTTLLAQQHAVTFTERYAPFPVRVGVLSRFGSAREHEQIIEAMAAGTVDVVVGTHRLLSADAKWADLGMVIIDEEHRFGVAHKEHLKRLRTQVDVLTLTATPIPRSLEMAVSGIRDLSVMETPPEERHPVLTFVGPYDERQVSDAIRRELLREGQTFLVHNRVDTIDRVAGRVRELIPEARVAVAHGQMGEDALERVMVAFWERAYDVLVCTTIIESGIDIPTANTLLVDRADTLGLAQLYQLRGRVGRSRERGYAYFFYPPGRTLAEQAHQRLATIATHTDLGSGMAIALRDLEIRGAGNLLGGEQSGQVATVGYDLYMQMLGEAVAELRGRPVEQPKDVKLEVPVDAHLPATYIPRERLRLEAYRRLGAARSVEEVNLLAAELDDRYGAAPEPVANLLALALVRAQATALGLRDVVCFGGRVRLAPIAELPESRQLRLARVYKGSVYKPAESTLLVPLPTAGEPLPAWLSQLLSDILDAPVVTDLALRGARSAERPERPSLE